MQLVFTSMLRKANIVMVFDISGREGDSVTLTEAEASINTPCAAEWVLFPVKLR